MTANAAPDQPDPSPTFGRRQFLLVGGSLVAAVGAKKSTTTTKTTAKRSTTSTTMGDMSMGTTSTGSRTSTKAPVGGDSAATPYTAKGPSTAGHQRLWIPPTISGTTFDLTLRPATKQMLSGAKTATYAYNGSEFWGPTLLMQRGDTVKLSVTNRLAEATTTHWHGFHIPPEMDGGPHQVVPAGSTWSPSFEVKNDAATYWYHPHMHETTMKQLNMGAGGFIIVRDEKEAALGLPRTYGVDDIPLMLTSRTFTSGNQISTTTIYGDKMLTNGVLNAEVGLPAQVVRLRLLNAEIERAYDLGFSDGRTFHVIATDGGLVNAPVPVTRLLMSPGERYEICVDLSGDAVGGTLDLQSFNGGQTFGFPGGEPATSGGFGSLLNNTTFDVLRINVIARTAGGVSKLPKALASNTYLSAKDATKSRTIAITDTGPGTPFTFDDAGYAMDTMNQTVKLNTTEKWTIKNGQVFGHSFHIHDVQFAIVARSTGAVPAHERGWKDTFFIRIGESVDFVARFADFASRTNPFMYHCHMSNHEDEGLMGQFLVVP